MSSEVSISFVVPVLNGDATIDDCLRSILGQRGGYEVEVIVVDNGSRDRSVENIQKFPVKLIREPQLGRSNARNRGLLEARGKWVAFIDCDVLLDQDWLLRMMEAVEGTGYMVAQGKVLPEAFLESKTQSYRKQLSSRLNPTRNSLNGRYFIHPCLNSAACFILRSSLMKVKGFDPNLKTFEDVDLAWRLWLSGCSFRVVEHACARVYWMKMDIHFFFRFFKMSMGEAIFLSVWGVREVGKLSSMPVPGELLAKYPIFESLRLFLRVIGREVGKSLISRNPHSPSEYSLMRIRPASAARIFQIGSEKEVARPFTRFLLTSEYLIVKNCQSMRKLTLEVSCADHEISLAALVFKYRKCLSDEQFLF